MSKSKVDLSEMLDCVNSELEQARVEYSRVQRKISRLEEELHSIQVLQHRTELEPAFGSGEQESLISNRLPPLHVDATTKLNQRVKEAAAILSQQRKKAPSHPSSAWKSTDELSGKDPGNQTLNESIMEIISTFGAAEFERPDIDRELKNLGKFPKGSSPEAKIAYMLQRLERSGLIIKTFAGAGSTPNKFRSGRYASKILTRKIF